MLAGDYRQADHRVLIHPDQATGLANAAILLEVVQHGNGFVLGKFAAVESRPFAFGETLLAGSAGQDTAGFSRAVAKADAQVVQAPAAVVLALRVLAAEGC